SLPARPYLPRNFSLILPFVCVLQTDSCRFFFYSTAPTEIYTLSLHDALPILILVVWFLLPRVARLMIHTPTAISIFVCLSMVQLMAVFISMRCTLCGHFLQVALTLILVVGYAIAAS